MKIERLSTDNLREGIFCPNNKNISDDVHDEFSAWIEGNQLRGQIARDDDGEVVGYVLYYPIEYAPIPVAGEGLYMVQCLLIKPGYENRGIGRALIESALDDAKNNDALGLAVEGFKYDEGNDNDRMPASFFEHIGMQPGESRETGTIYYLAFNQKMQPPQYTDCSFTPLPGHTRVRIDILDCRKCFTSIANHETVIAAIERTNADVEVHVHDQSSREAVLDKGMSSGIFIDGKLTFFRGPIEEEDVLNAIEIAYKARKQATDR